MSNVDIIINDKHYKVGCSSEDKEDVLRYSKELEKRIKLFKEDNPAIDLNLSHETTFLFQALWLIAEIEYISQKKSQEYADEIQELNERLKSLERHLEELQKVVKS